MSKARKAGGSNGDPKLAAVQVSYAALRDLTVDEQLQVLASIRALLSLPSSSGGAAEPEAGDIREQTTSARKRLSLVELLSDKKPKTNPERIALFAYYREHIERSPQFERDDLRPYFAKARVPAPTNFDRDFVGAVRQGWIHEDGASSYLTNSGSQAVETGFGVESLPKRRGSKKPRRAKRSRKSKGRGRR